MAEALVVAGARRRVCSGSRSAYGHPKPAADAARAWS
jgi:hypothetical protein